MERRLAAILAADMVGYSRLMGADEAGTLDALKSVRADVVIPAVAGGKGRVVKLMGDGLLIEFPSVVGAVECALVIQRQMLARNAGEPESRRIVFRIGVNLGDVIIEGDDIYGDGVNVAARLEALAEPGGISISGEVYRHVEGKLKAEFDDLGEQSLKNISRPIHVYNVRRSHISLETSTSGKASPKLPDKPSVAVLPFSSMSSDKELEFFADGITEEIITALSRIPYLFVVARNTTFVFKGRAVDAKGVAKELGVSAVLEGSVRASANKVRVTAQLIDGASGHHLWAERYDGNLDDVFQVQDDITRNIALALQVKLTYGELARLWEGQTQNFRAWEKMVEGRKRFNLMNRTDNITARRYFEEAIALDAGYGAALVQLGLTHWWDARYTLDLDPEAALAQAEAVIERLKDLGNNESAVHYLTGYVAFVRRQHDTAIAELEKAVSQSPSDSWMLAVLGQVYMFAGRHDRAVEALQNAMRLSPYYPEWYAYNLAQAYAWRGENEDDALDLAEGYVRRLPGDPYGYTNLATVQSFFGHEPRAAVTIRKLRQRYSGFGVRNLLRSELYKNPADLDRVLGVLKSLGLPE